MDSWDNMDLASTTSKSTIGLDDKLIDNTTVGLKRPVEKTMTDREQEGEDKYEDAHPYVPRV